jgi:hypothetical protein
MLTKQFNLSIYDYDGVKFSIKGVIDIVAVAWRCLWYCSLMSLWNGDKNNEGISDVSVLKQLIQWEIISE